jgi:hypothetical protein
MSASYEELLDYVLGANVRVNFKTDRGVMVDYSVVLVVGSGGDAQTVRLYDGSHGRNEMHRYSTGAGKRPAEVFHRGTLSEGMQDAIEAIEDGYVTMIEGWEAR